MATVQHRKELVENLLSSVKQHHMCLYFTEDKYYYIVQYPDGMRFDGVRIEKGASKSKSLERLLLAMERHWDESRVTPCQKK